MGIRHAEILLVEDDADDVALLREALKTARMSVILNVVEDGVKALAYLRREPPYDRALRPDLVLLDLRLPKRGGLEVLRDVKGDDALRSIPVLVLAGAADEADVAATYRLGANGHLPKPASFEQYENIVRLLEEFWFGAAKLPPRKRRA